MMKLTTETQALLVVLKHLARVVPTTGARSRLGTLGCVQILAGDLLEDPAISGTDGVATARLRIKAEVSETGEAVAELGRLLPLISACPDKEVELVASAAPNGSLRLSVRSGPVKATMGLRAPEDWPTLPETPDEPAASPVVASKLFPALARAIALGATADDAMSVAGCSWDIKGGRARVVAIQSSLSPRGSFEEVAALGEVAEARIGQDVQPGRMLPSEWSMLKELGGIGALNGASEVRYARMERATYWSGPGWEVWFQKTEHPRGATMEPETYANKFKPQGESSELGDGSLSALRRACAAISSSNGAQAVVRWVGDESGWTLRIPSDVDPFEWHEPLPVGTIDWSAREVGALAAVLDVIAQIDGPVMLSAVPRSGGLLFERGGIACMIAGHK